jgi:WYL domain
MEGKMMALLVLLGTIGFLIFIWQMPRKSKETDQAANRTNGSFQGGREQPPSRIETDRRTVPLTKTELPKSDDERDYDIEYGDVDGVVTNRRIKVLDLEGSAEVVYLRAVCSLRNAERTFRADRILNARSAMTGERFHDPVGHFRSQFVDLHQKDPDHEAVMVRVRGGLNLLIWIAMADREISSDEQEILLEFITARNALAGTRYASVAWNRARAARYIDQSRPTFSVAAGFLAGISKTGREWRMIDEFSIKVAAVGGLSSENRRRQLFK